MISSPLLQGSWYKFLKAISIAVGNFGVIWLISYYTNAETLGRFQFIISFMGIAALTAMPGIKTAIVQSVSNNFFSSLEIGTRFSIKRAFIGSILLIVASAYFLLFRNDYAYAYGFISAAIFFPFFYTLDNYTLFLTATQNFKKEAISYFCIYASLCTALFFTLYVGVNSLAQILFVYLSIQILFYVLFFFQTIHTAAMQKTIHDTDLISYGVFLTKVSYLEIISRYADKILIGLFINPVSLAIYSISIMFVEKSSVFLKPVLMVLYPQFSTNKIILKNKHIIAAFGVTTGIAAIYFFSIGTVLKIFFPAYAETSTGLAQLYALSLIFLPVSILFDYYFKAKKKRKIILRFTSITKILYLVLIVPTLYFFSVSGLIVIKTGFLAFECLIYMTYLNKIKPQNIYNYFRKIHP